MSVRILVYVGDNVGGGGGGGGGGSMTQLGEEGFNVVASQKELIICRCNLTVVTKDIMLAAYPEHLKSRNGNKMHGSQKYSREPPPPPLKCPTINTTLASLHTSYLPLHVPFMLMVPQLLHSQYLECHWCVSPIWRPQSPAVHQAALSGRHKIRQVLCHVPCSM